MIDSTLQLINYLIDSCKSNYQGLISFYNMNWYGLERGHYMTYLGLGGVALVTLETYLKVNKNKNDVRRFLIDEKHRG